MKLATIWNAREALGRLSQLRKPPKVAYQLMKYEKLVMAEIDTIDKARTAFIMKAAGVADAIGPVTLDVGTPELVAFTIEFNAFLETESDLSVAPLNMDALIDALDGQAGNAMADSDLALVEPFFTEKTVNADAHGYPYLYLHLHGGVPCGKPAALMTELPPPYAASSSEIFRNLEGQKLNPASPCICGSCGGTFDPLCRSAIRTADGSEAA